MNYKDKRWEHKRENILRRDGYKCRQCKRYGKTTPATMVHHINPSETHPTLVYTDDNLISLCWKCHELMHHRATGEITALGMEWVSRVADKLINKKT